MAGRNELHLTDAVLNIDAQEIQTLQGLREILQVQDGIWQKNKDPCYDWPGVSCKNGHVVSLSLSSVSYKVSLRDESLLLELTVQALSHLSFLRSFNATGYEFRGCLPESIGKLNKLNILDLTRTALQGAVPASLKLLTSLEFLSLAENNLTGSVSPSMDGLADLKHLDLSYNSFTGSLPFTLFSKAFQLVYVDLSHNKFENQIPPFIGQLVNLRHLALGHNDLQGNLPIKHLNLSRLEYLDVSANNLQGPIADTISHMRSLAYLNLERNYFTGSIPSAISNCTRLQTLILDRNMLNNNLPPSVATLSNLVTLSLSFNNLSGIIPSKIFTLPKLTTLVVSHNLFFGPIAFKELRPRLMQALDLSYNFLQGDPARELYPVENVVKNCFQGAPNQHTPKACRQFYRRVGVAWHEMPPKSVLPGGSSVSPLLDQGHTHKNKLLLIILGCAVGGAFVLAIAGACAVCNEKFKDNLAFKDNLEFKDDLELEIIVEEGETNTERGSSLDKDTFSSFLGESFPYDKLHRATGGFSSSQMLANGQSGELYKGILEEGTVVVVKRVYTTKKIELCLKELQVFQRASHRRLITVLGHCMDAPDEKFLVYKYMPYGDLASVLQMKNDIHEGTFHCCQRPLDWITRLKIAIGVAEGLTYLHHECSPPIVHGNVKATSILLDEKFEVRLGSLSFACSEDTASPAKLISCLFSLSRPLDYGDADLTTTDRSKGSKDVYDFGKLLLELLSGNCGITERRDFQTDSWVEWAVSLIHVHDKEALYQLLDPSLVVCGDFLDEAMVMAVVAKACLSSKVSKRPNMRHALKALRNPTLLFQEEKARSRLSQVWSQQSWNTALFGALRSVGASSSVSASENNNDIISTAGNSTFLVQNASFVSEIEELSLGEIQEV
ncbi:hypothetical protein GOP47_0004901 [Adiantum capillus-veneris]|uniref:Protein kinase domain-containing protein n=1 Tax=Adiantum capillus-veneris TaxID=13818 RepID=A0A9D4V5Q9_ADICA|nr:hypothetical protein GOP47_0004901 [Adiantum capillus-veneris]